MKHTPGPWGTSRDAVPHGHVQITVYAESTGVRVATVFDREANAPLIAAAPAMFAALYRLTEIAREITRGTQYEEDIAPALLEAQTAIDKMEAA